MPTINKPRKPNKRSTKRIERMQIYNTARWRELRHAKMMNNPLCEQCLKEGRVTTSNDIHHIQSFMSAEARIDRLSLAFDYSNLMSLCKECHQKMHND